MKKCDVCNKPFKNAHGVAVHKQRSPAGSPCKEGLTEISQTRRNRRSPSKRIVGKNGESGKEAIRQILADHPQGLSTDKIFAELQQRGLKPHTNYVSQAAAADPSVVRVERGVYRLKKGLKSTLPQQTGTAVVQDAIDESKAHTLPREALLLRIETLESHNRALRDAHLSLIRGVFV